MRKNTKQVLLIILAILLTISVCVVLACCDDDHGPDDNPNLRENGSVQTIAPPEDGIDKIDYAITVKYPDGTAVLAAEVQLFSVDDEDNAYSGATTGNDGIAYLNAGKGLEYFIVIKNLPDGYLYEDEVLVHSDETEKVVFLASANASDTYKFTVVSVGGMPMEKVVVTLKDGKNIVGKKNTDEKGVASIRVGEKKAYTIEISELPVGYSLVEENLVTSDTVAEQEIKVQSAVIKEELPKNYRYEMDDIMYDFSYTTSDGATFTLSEALEEYDFVLINFWATWCTPCRSEFEGIQKSYERYQGKMAVIALSIDDTLTAIASFKSSYSPTLTFDMASDKSKALYSTFTAYHGSAVPISIFVDRYGKICNFYKGGASEAFFRQEFGRYTDPDYVQVAYDPANDVIPPDEGEKPDVDMPSSESINEAINKDGFTGEYVAENDGTYWPWVLSDNNELIPGNIKRNNTTAIISYNFKLKEGEFLTFDYYTNTEDVGNADILTAYIDGSEVLILDRVTNGKWKTAFLYTPLSAAVDAKDAEREHTLMLVYAKDASDGFLSGEEAVAVKNMRAVGISGISGDVNILRDAAWGYDEETSRYTSYIKPVFNEKDGYYHVGSADGPYLLANLGGATRYSNYSISEYASGGYFRLAGISSLATYINSGLDNPPEGSYIESNKGYAWFAAYSTLENYTLVDATLKTTLDMMCKKMAEANKNRNNKFAPDYYTSDTWLEVCSYYDNYSGEAIQNPLTGISDKEAIVAYDGGVANHVVVDRVLVPRGMVYRFDCTVSGAYKIYSVMPDELIGKQGAYVNVSGKGISTGDDAIDDFAVYVTFEAGESYYIYVAFDLPSNLGELDFYIEMIGESYDRFTYVSTGLYTWLLDEDGDPLYDDEGNIIYVLATEVNTALDIESNTYRQLLSDGSMDMGDKGQIYIAASASNMLFEYTLEELAKGMAGSVSIKFEELDGINFFDFTNEGGEDYTQKILEYVEKAKAQEGDLKGYIVADKEIVEIIAKAMARIGHDSENSWMGFAFYYQHLGAYNK